MNRELLEELLSENRLTEIKSNLNEMNEFDIAELIEDLPEK